MADSSYEQRRGFTFAQAEGVEPLPSQLKRTEVTSKLAALVWAVLHREFTADVYTSSLTGHMYVKGRWEAILRDYHVFSQHRPIDEFSSDLHNTIKSIKSVVFSGNYIAFYEFIQFVIRHNHCTIDFIDKVTSASDRPRAIHTRRSAYFNASGLAGGDGGRDAGFHGHGDQSACSGTRPSSDCRGSANNRTIYRQRPREYSCS